MNEQTAVTVVEQEFYYEQLEPEVQQFYDDIEQQVSDTNDQWRTAIGAIIQQVIDVRGRDEALAWFMHRFQKSQTTFYKYLRLANGEDTWAIEREQKQHKAIAEKAQFLQNSVNDELLSELDAQLTAAAQNRTPVEKEHVASAVVVDEKPPASIPVPVDKPPSISTGNTHTTGTPSYGINYESRERYAIKHPAQVYKIPDRHIVAIGHPDLTRNDIPTGIATASIDDIPAIIAKLQIIYDAESENSPC